MSDVVAQQGSDASAETVWVYFGSEAGFADQPVHAGPIDQYTLSVAAQHPAAMRRLAIVNAPHPYVFQRSLIDDREQRRASHDHANACCVSRARVGAFARFDPCTIAR